MHIQYVPDDNNFLAIPNNPYRDQDMFALVQKDSINGESFFIPNTPAGRSVLRCLAERGTPLPQLAMDLPILPNDIDFGDTKPMEHQRDIISRLIHYNLFLLAADMGVGKTYCVIQLMKYLSRTTNDAFLVICPPKVIPTWEAQIQRFAPELRVFACGDKFPVHMRSALITTAMLCKKSVIVTNYETFVSTKAEIEDKNGDIIGGFESMFRTGKTFGCIVLDESTKIKNTTAKRTQGLMRIKKLSNRRICMSGFPSPQSPADYVGQCAFLHPWFLGYDSAGKFTSQYGERDPYTQRVDSWKPSCQEMLKKCLPHFAVSINLKDTDIKLPELLYKTVSIEMTEEQRSIYNKVESDFVAWLNANNSNLENILPCPSCESGNIGEDICDECEGTGVLGGMKASQFALFAKNALVKFQKLGQITGGWGGVKKPCTKCQGQHFLQNNTECRKCDQEGYMTVHVPLKENPKMETLIEFCKNGDALIQKPYIIFSYYRHELEHISRELNIPLIWGGTTEAELKMYIDQLQKGLIEGIAVQPAAGGMGVDGMQAARTAIYYTNSFNLESRVQSEKRLHRIGQKNPVTVIDFTCKKTVDEYVIDRLQQKKSIGMDILDFGKVVSSRK